MITETVIEIRLAGSGLVPGNVRSKDLAEVIDSVEDMIASLIEREYPEISKEDVIVGLVALKEGSVRLQFASQLPNLVRPAYARLAQSVQKEDYTGLPSSSLDSLKKITSFSRRKNCELEFWTHNGKSEMLATIKPNTLIQPIPLIAGPTTIYGEVIRVGGKHPRAVIQLESTVTVSCTLDISLAKQLAMRLYTWVGLYGTGKWNAKDFKLDDFNIERILDYEDAPITNAMSELSKLIGGYFDDIDPEQYVAELRGGELED